MNTHRHPSWIVGALLAACATEQPDAPLAFDSSAGIVVVTVCGDGFVREGDQRMPLEACVLRLRQRTRAMPREERLRFVVQLLVEPQAEGSEAAARARQGMERLVGELEVMGVRQIRYL